MTTHIISILTLPPFQRSISRPTTRFASAPVDWRSQCLPSAQFSNPLITSRAPPWTFSCSIRVFLKCRDENTHSIPQVKASVCYLFPKLFLEPPVSCWPLWPHQPVSADKPKDNLLASFPPLFSGTDSLQGCLTPTPPPDNSNFSLLYGCSLPQVRISKKQNPFCSQNSNPGLSVFSSRTHAGHGFWQTDDAATVVETELFRICQLPPGAVGEALHQCQSLWLHP